jgi:hypothetical protein
MNTFGHFAFALLVLFIVPTTGASVAHAQTRLVELQGEVRDQLEAVIVGARVSLTDEHGFRREAFTGEQGRFRFSALPPGPHVLSVVAEGFAAHAQELLLGHGDRPPRMVITLYPTITETVNVGRETVGLDAANAAGAQVLTARELEALPDDPDQLEAQLQQLATSSGSAPGQATVTVDGFLSGGRMPPKSALREVRINPDLYSAEYDTPPYRGGRIEIYTRPGADAFHGSGFFNFNGSALNARETFAPVRAQTQTRRYGFQLGGPIVSKRSGFLLDFERRDIDEVGTVNAVILDKGFLPAPFAASVAAPRRLLIGSARADWQLDAKNTLVTRYDFNVQRLENQGVGGFNLPDRGFDSRTGEHSFRLTETAILSRRRINELRLGLTLYRLGQEAQSDSVAVNVPGSFAQGGATPQFVRRRELRLEIADYISIITSRHNLKFGVQIFNKQVRDVRSENPLGTFFFGGGLAPEIDAAGNIAGGQALVNISGLEQYRRTLLGLPGGVPTRFTITRGDPSVGVSQWLLSGFIQDEWRLRKNLSLNLGLRYEGQNAPSDKASIAPRAGIAFSPDREQRWVLRARAGLFYERISEALMLETSRLDGLRQQQFLISSPTFPDPFAVPTLINTIPTVRRLDEQARPPASLQMQLALERQMPRGWKISLSHSWTRGWGSLRSRNINAPLIEGSADPLLAPRPSGVNENVLQFESSGRIKGRVLFLGVNQSAHKYFTLNFGYLFFDFKTDADTPFTLPQSSYSSEGEWARPYWQSSHRIFLVGTLNLPWKMRAAATLNAASGTPFNITTGRDNNGDGEFTDRPSPASASEASAIVTRFGAFDAVAANGTLGRNAGTNPSTATLDVNLSRTFTFGKRSAAAEGRYKLALNVRAGNLLNHTNLLGLNGVLASPFFGRANQAAPARHVELGLRLSF